MEVHTIVLAVTSILSLPVLVLYWTTSRRAVQAHLELLCKRDNLDPTAEPRLWKQLEKRRLATGVGYLLLLIVWGTVQCYLGNSKSTMDWVFTWVFAISYAGIIVVALHYQREDVLNSMGLGQRAQMSMSAHLAPEKT
ncbi:MAG: hypothetical protein HY711_01170 [Candidatus Melainabacteria bacterium]|nr:hypothetical protein [Candidatus Melainabacteria bacterium]